MSWRAGLLVTNTFSTESEDSRVGLAPEQFRRAAGGQGVLIFVHNHPASSLPSAADIRALKVSGAGYGLIAAHDGPL